jgi:hypothetical protein
MHHKNRRDTKYNLIKSFWLLYPRDAPDIRISHDDLRYNGNINDVVSWDGNAGCVVIGVVKWRVNGDQHNYG